MSNKRNKETTHTVPKEMQGGLKTREERKKIPCSAITMVAVTATTRMLKAEKNHTSNGITLAIH